MKLEHIVLVHAVLILFWIVLTLSIRKDVAEIRDDIQIIQKNQREHLDWHAAQKK